MRQSWLTKIVPLAIIVALFMLERRYPLRQSALDEASRRGLRNVGLAALSGAAIAATETPLTSRACQYVELRRIGLLPRLALPARVERLVGLLILDYSLYWWHILLHRVPWLWRAHRVHHLDFKLDITTAARFHFVEFVASVPWRLGQILLIGVNQPLLTLWQRLTVLEVAFHHSNLRLAPALDRGIRLAVMTPRLHGIHHSIVAEQTDSNYSSGLSIWDHLHNTYRCDEPACSGKPQPVTIGSPDDPYRRPRSFPALVTLPFATHDGTTLANNASVLH